VRLHAREVSLLLRNVIFTIVVPGSGAVLFPWLILGGRAANGGPLAWLGVTLIVAGGALYLWCLWLFARVGRGTPGPWDAPRRLVVGGPYRWVRNPIYVGALLVVVGEAALFGSIAMIVYGVVAAVFFHLFVIGYEEPTLEAAFGADYGAYRKSVWRWLPTPPGPMGARH
jgi:protein-S-isoprenylcysteine O-methyltransferase Ste14